MYLGVREDFTRCFRELEEGVLFSWCSGVVSGPKRLTGNNEHLRTNLEYTHKTCPSEIPQLVLCF